MIEFEKFECRCRDNFKHIADHLHGKGRSMLVDLKKNKLYTCEYVTHCTFEIRVYDNNRFIWFENEEEFSKYFNLNQYLRNKKLKKLQNI